jgi:hypothetical protein
MGCANPKHLYWGTRSDNVQDAIKHGTFSRWERPSGSDHPRARYTDEQIARAFDLVRSGMKQIDVVKVTGVKQQTISRVVNGKSWKNLKT